ncbi:hypothetical protein I7I48_07088 [Histoplasma ohiense]|nr:hypothetical protein I7I48_07088 [Histoplasma ohiense (nom. inval.)]
MYVPFLVIQNSAAVMANNQTLLNYLMVAPPALPIQNANKTRNTTNSNYNWEDINSVGQWLGFTYTHIMHCYGILLHQTQIASEINAKLPPTAYKRGADVCSPF